MQSGGSKGTADDAERQEQIKALYSERNDGTESSGSNDCYSIGLLACGALPRCKLLVLCCAVVSVSCAIFCRAPLIKHCGDK